MQKDSVGNPGNHDEYTLSEQIIERLRAGKLPQMVDWFDPALLARIGVRELISGTMGQYADQRLLQAASDRVNDERELALRYDYSGGETDQNGEVWVDYIADLGDGFEATYSMAYLLAQDALDIEGASSLPAGEILVMGGDQAYPQATTKEYQNRLLNPYNWAFTTTNPQRKLFALPGNHDWYDGLTAFDSLFCSARDRISGGIGKQIGGWRCHQHRSYFAIKLPHDWWIWGADIQLEGNLDDPQRDYFDLVSEHMNGKDKVIICLAEPSWLHDDYENLHEINMLARKSGAKVCAVLAGDWHHYSRYHSPDLGVHFITCGGGGAFAHATHQLRNKLELHWAHVTGDDHRVSDPKDSPEFDQMEKRIVDESGTVDFTEETYEISTDEEKRLRSGQGASERKSRPTQRTPVAAEAKTCTVSHIYPSKLKSRLLCLRNLWLPFHNFRFALFVGLIYFMYAWVFHLAVPTHPLPDGLAEQVVNEATAAKQLAERAAAQAKLLSVHATALESGAQGDSEALQNARNQAKAAAAFAESAANHAQEIQQRADVLKQHQKKIEPQIDPSEPLNLLIAAKPSKLLDAAGASPAFLFMVLGLWVGLIFYVDASSRLPSVLRNLTKLIIGTFHFLAHMIALLAINTVAQIATGVLAAIVILPLALFGLMPEGVLVQALVLVAYFLISVLLGGLLGAFIFGIYWVLTSTIASMHCADAFGALGLKDYKHFLRMRFEPDQVTIYPIAIDKVPGPKEWRARSPASRQRTPVSQIVPDQPLSPHLIEDAIVIKAADVS